MNTPSINRGLRNLWIGYIAFVFYGTLIPFSLCLDNQCIQENIQQISWTPFMDNDGSPASINDAVQNILFFIPFGLLGILSRRPCSIGRIIFVTLLGALLSTSVECLQLLTTNRISSVTDLIMNTAGTLAGCLSVCFLLSLLKSMSRYSTLQSLKDDRCFHLLLVGFALLVLGLLQPFDITLDVRNVWANLKFLLRKPLAFTPLKDDGIAALRFLLFSWVLCIWLRRRGIDRAAWTGWIVTCLIGIGLELSQFIVRSRSPSIQDAIVVLVGGLMGCVLFRIRPEPERDAPMIWIVLIVASSWLCVAMYTLSPFIVNIEYTDFNWLPFTAYYEKTTFVALSNFIESILLFFHLGFILRLLIPNNRKAIFVIAVFSLLIAVPLEVLQGWIVGRHPDITDIMGALTGALLASWSAHPFVKPNKEQESVR